MSDTTSIGSILNQRINANNTPDSATPNLKIVKIPKDLEDSDRPQKLRGEVTHKDNSGTIKIRTNKGEITAKVERPTTVQKGDIVDVKIDKGSPPQTAHIRPAPKQINTTQNQVQNYTQLSSNISVPPNLSAQELINAAPVKVTTFPTQHLPTVKELISEKITTNVGLISNLPLLTSKPLLSVASPLQILLAEITLPELSALPVLSSSPSLDIPQTPPPSVPPILSVLLQHITTEIPLYHIAAKAAANLKAFPITISLLSPETATHTPLSEVKIIDITPPLTQIRAPRSSDGYRIANEGVPPTTEKAGETHSILIGFTENKHFPILRITAPQSRVDQHYTLQTPVSDIPIGTQIEISVTQTTPIPSVHSSLIAPLPSLSQASFFTPEIWPIMQEIQNVLTQLNPQTAQVFSNIIPNPGAPAQFNATVLFFIAALRSGDLQSWVGEKVIETLKRAGKGDLLTRLGSEMSSLSRLGSEPAPQEWRTLSLPLAWQNDIHRMVLHYRREDDSGSENEQNGSGTKTRFVMDVNLSQMGKVQLDGLFIGNPEGVGRLDLILRTEQGFSQAMKQEMRVAYKNALDDTSFTGELSFQGQIDGWVHITPDMDFEFTKDV
ncbi:MAG: hypothetical protein COA45_09860 [Zetaproteobacteria bacterium]|nr:MAG: hypothetical protein COA45_09860 [Zetaproteobacteria bacterium]